MTDDEALGKIKTVLSTVIRIDPYGYVANPDTVARCIMDEVVGEIQHLRAALHRISLGSQDSGTTKEGLGREARAALARLGPPAAVDSAG